MSQSSEKMYNFYFMLDDRNSLDNKVLDEKRAREMVRRMTYEDLAEPVISCLVVLCMVQDINYTTKSTAAWRRSRKYIFGFPRSDNN